MYLKFMQYCCGQNYDKAFFCITMTCTDRLEQFCKPKKKSEVTSITLPKIFNVQKERSPKKVKVLIACNG